MTIQEIETGIAQLAEGFMTPQIWRDDVLEITLTNGDTVLSLARYGLGDWAEEIAVKDNGIDIEVISHKGVWCARLSANGYMDCTEMTIHPSERAAAEYLVETYGE